LTRFRIAAVMAALALLILPARSEDLLRIAMTASDIPTATGVPNNGFEGYRFLGFPIFEGLVLWDLTRADRLAGLRPGLAETYEQAPDDKRTWVFHLRHGRQMSASWRDSFHPTTSPPMASISNTGRTTNSKLHWRGFRNRAILPRSMLRIASPTSAWWTIRQCSTLSMTLTRAP
jgi:ABC-type oligopeptide transport system substrate-binding subunit